MFKISLAAIAISNLNALNVKANYFPPRNIWICRRKFKIQRKIIISFKFKYFQLTFFAETQFSIVNAIK